MAVYEFSVNRLGRINFSFKAKKKKNPKPKVCAFASQTCSSFLSEIKVRNLRKKPTVIEQNNSQLEGEAKRLNMGYNNTDQNFLLLTAKN